MHKLIKNELFKLFSKKSTYVLLIIAILYSIFVNFIYNTDIDKMINSAINDVEVEFCKTSTDKEDYYCKSVIDASNLKEEFKSNSWQQKIIEEKYLMLAEEYYANNSDEEAKKAYNDALNALRNDNWQYFTKQDLISNEENLKYVNEELKMAKDSDKAQIKAHIKYIEEEKEMLEFRLNKNIAYGYDYLNEAIENSPFYASESELYNLAQTDKEKSEHEKGMKKYYENKYILDTLEDTNNSQSLRGVLSNFFSEYSFLILVFVIMIAGGIVSDEFNKGTIKSLLIIPFSRTKILLSKFITVLMMFVFFIVFLFICQIIIGGLIFGYDSLKIPIIAYNLATNSLEIVNVFKYFLLTLCANLPQILLMLTLAFAVSIIFNSTALAITITFCGFIAANIINSFALAYDLEFLNYFVTTNWDFTNYLFGGINPFGNSLTHAIIICLIYFIIMIVASFIIFKKRDIKNI